MTYRDPTTGRFATEPEPPKPRTEHAVFTFGNRRSDWLPSQAAAMDEAIRLGLASYDASRREHYLAVPTSIRTRRI